MPKEAKKQPKKNFQLLTTNQSNAYKEQVKKQTKTLMTGTDEKYDHMMQTNPDPNYLSIYKKNYHKNMQRHPLDQMLETQFKYDPKQKKDRHFNIRQEKDVKETYQFPLTANQEYGWRQPIDTFPTNFGMKHTFDEKLSTALTTMNKAKKQA